MTTLPFQELTQRLEEALYQLHYSKASIAQYRRMWKRMATFFDQEGIDSFSEEAGMRFLDEQFHFFEREKAGTLTQSIINVLRIVRMLGDFQQHGSILRRYYRHHKELLQTDALKKVLQGYQAHCRQREYAKATQEHYRKIAEQLLSFLEPQGIRQPADIMARHLSGYIRTLMGYSYKTVELQLCGLRSFLRYLHDTGLHSDDLSTSIPPLKTRKQTRIPSVWTPENITKLLEVVDRGNPGGKRDYAILLLVTRLGLRSIDIKHLKLSDLRWRDNRIELIQSKTASVLTLPLLPDVGWAIIDYLKNGRPKVDSPYVFLRHLAPLVPFSDADRLNQIIVKYMKLAKIPISPDQKRGMHSLRHTLASRLLAEKTPLPVISEILGHLSSDSTAVYLKVDIHRLRECALDLEEGERHD